MWIATREVQTRKEANNQGTWEAKPSPARPPDTGVATLATNPESADRRQKQVHHRDPLLTPITWLLDSTEG
jgi:hypothetical protein